MDESLQSAVVARQVPSTISGRGDRLRILQSVLAGGSSHRKVVTRVGLKLLGHALGVPYRMDCSLVPHARDSAGYEAGYGTIVRQHARFERATSRRSNAVSVPCGNPIRTGLAAAVSGHALQGQS